MLKAYSVPWMLLGVCGALNSTLGGRGIGEWTPFGRCLLSYSKESMIWLFLSICFLTFPNCTTALSLDFHRLSLDGSSRLDPVDLALDGTRAASLPYRSYFANVTSAIESRLASSFVFFMLRSMGSIERSCSPWCEAVSSESFRPDPLAI
eukprot:3184707-Rhodomonas_salina.1